MIELSPRLIDSSTNPAGSQGAFALAPNRPMGPFAGSQASPLC